MNYIQYLNSNISKQGASAYHNSLHSLRTSCYNFIVMLVCIHVYIHACVYVQYTLYIH